jgi:serine/threonine-protein kinase
VGDLDFGTMAGRKIGDYTVGRKIGVGGMGTVFAATGSNGVPVAIKIVAEQVAHDEVLRERFHREAQVAQRVVHRNVVPVLDTGEIEGIPYIVQQLMPSGSLHERLRAHATLEVPDLVRVCEEVAAGLDALHDAGVIHRDVKPGNVLFDEDDTAMVTDFGLSLDSSAERLTRPGQALGSMDYMAPEQVRGQDPTPATDVYGLACVAFHCLQGDPPFADRPPAKVMLAHLQDLPADPSANRDDAPPPLGAAIVRGLAKDPGQRPSSAGAFAEAMRRAAGC